MSEPTPTPAAPGGPSAIEPVRPASVTVAVTLLWIYALLNLAAGVVYVVIGADKRVSVQEAARVVVEEQVSFAEAEQILRNAQTLFMIIGVVFIVVGLIALLAAVGLARGSRGWYVFTMIVTIIALLGQLLSVVQIRLSKHSAETVFEQGLPSLIAMLITLVVLLCLVNGQARDYFRSR